MKQKIIFLFLLMVVFLAGCTFQGNDTPDNETQATETTEYVVTFVVDGVESTQKVKEGDKVTKPEDPIKESYIFLGWFTDEICESEYDFETKVSASFKLYAGFEEDVTKQEYKVTFETNGGTLDGEIEVSVTHGMTVIKPTDPIKEGYTFEGWFTDSALNTEFDFSTAITSALVLYAKYEEIVINAKYNIAVSSSASLLYQGNCAADGNEDTYWKAANNDVQTLTIDLESVKAVSFVSQEFVDLANWEFEIKASIDGERYVPLLSNNASGTKFTANVNGYYRYIVLEIAASDVVATSKEFYVESSELGNGYNVALGSKGATCCHAGGYEIEKIFDGKFDNFHCCAGYHENHYMGADFISPVYVTTLEIYLPDATDHKFYVDYADANGQWHELEAGNFRENTEKQNYWKIDVNLEIKAILVHHNGNSTGNWPAINEMVITGFRNNESTATIVDNKEVYDFGEVTYIGRVAILDKSGTNRQIEVSKDGSIWTPVDMENVIGEYLIINQEARYVRYSDDRAELPSNNIKIYSLSYTRNLALLTNPTATTRSGDPGFWENMMVFNPDCNQGASRLYCSSGYALEEVINLDLGNVCYIQSMIYKWNDYSADAVYKLKIEVSVDGDTWSTIFDTNGPAAGQVFEASTTAATEYARYIRITAHHTTGWTNCNSLVINGIGSTL